jgi:CHAT domain-containing protein
VYGLLLWTVFGPLTPLQAQAQKQATRGEVRAPPRTITDITTILDQEKSGSAALAKNKAAADASVPLRASAAALYEFYLARGRARLNLGRLAEAVEDGEQAVKAGQGHVETRDVITAKLFIATVHLAANKPREVRKVTASIEAIPGAAQTHGVQGRLFSVYRANIVALTEAGDLTQAERYYERMRALMIQARRWTHHKLYAEFWGAEIERAKARIAYAKGNFGEAELAYGKAAELVKAAIKKLPTWPPPFGTRANKEQLEQRIDLDINLRGHCKAKQGRLSEAEADARAALLSRVKAQGKYTSSATTIIEGLASILWLQGRYPEADRLLRIALEIREATGVRPNSEALVENLMQLSSLAVLQRNYEEATRLDIKIDSLITMWEPERRLLLGLDNRQVDSLLARGRAREAVAAAEALLAQETLRLGETHQDVALIQGQLAVGYLKIDRAPDALAAFKKAIPVLLSGSRTTDIDDPSVIDFRSARIRSIVEAYVGFIMRFPEHSGTEAASETFPMIDGVRSRSVQLAVTAAAARMTVPDKGLRQLVWRQQDIKRQVLAKLSLLNKALAQPSPERDGALIRTLHAEVSKLRNMHEVALGELERLFPTYAELIEPQPASVQDARAVLDAEEALVTFYFGREKSFVWALTKNGPLAFAEIPLTEVELEAKIVRLRQALDSESIPVFDVRLAHELYQNLLEPVSSGWKNAKSLIVVTNGALGLLPLGILVRDPTAGVYDDKLKFTDYRRVSWLARTYATVQVPSVSALRALRQLASAAPTREPLIGFGDPLFSAAQALEASQQASRPEYQDLRKQLRRRALASTGRFDSAELSLLTRLPDTAEELKSIANALDVDAARTLFLQKAANERTVKTADLTRYRIVAFATHGLLPGDLNGLTQPALALTAPQVAGVDGDGLLMMDEVLALKLDADWVILSACNTGAGSSVGADALSGLGRAFFYAGTRALLITNWAVESNSARELVTDVFKRQAADRALSRAEALRQAMMSMLDGGDAGHAAYAHPQFWAPYSVVGEPRVR